MVLTNQNITGTKEYFFCFHPLYLAINGVGVFNSLCTSGHLPPMFDKLSAEILPLLA